MPFVTNSHSILERVGPHNMEVRRTSIMPTNEGIGAHKTPFCMRIPLARMKIGALSYDTFVLCESEY